MTEKKKTVWTVGELMTLIERGKLPYVDHLDRYKTIRNKLFREAEESIYKTEDD
jgi:hypothetical protein